MKKIVIILLSTLAVFSTALAGDEKPDYSRQVKMKVLKSKVLKLQTQIDSLQAVHVIEENACEAEKKQFQKDSTVFSLKSQLASLFLEIEELNK